MASEKVLMEEAEAFDKKFGFGKPAGGKKK
jgi:hypothetical protein